MKSPSHFGLLLTGGFWLALSLPAARGADDTIVVGMSAAFTGPSRGLGIELYRGSMAYFTKINDEGGVHGRKILLKAYDDGYNPLPAIDNTLRLIEKDDAFVLFDYVGTPTVTRVLPLLKRHSDQSVYLFCPFTGADTLRQPPYGPFVYNLRASYRDETKGLVDHFVENNRTKIAVFYQIDAYGRNGWDGVRQALAKKDLHMAAEATYHRGAPFKESMKEQVAILREADPDAVICVGAYAACAANVSFVGSENMLGLLADEGKSAGKDYTRNLINSQVVPSYHRQEFAAVKEYRKAMDEYDPIPPRDLAPADYKPLPYSFVSLEGYLNAKVLVEVLRKVGPDLDRARIPAAVESLTDLDLGIDIHASFGAAHHQGLDQVYYTVVDDGRFVRLLDWKRFAK
jgi:ABC-type branched-subunit amino acid transport system substrate-binding protein